VLEKLPSDITQDSLVFAFVFTTHKEEMPIYTNYLKYVVIWITFLSQLVCALHSEKTLNKFLHPNWGFANLQAAVS
jgi:hypothetical protein